VDEKEIKALLNRGAIYTKDIENFTRAGTSCGRCLPLIDEIVALHEKEKPKARQGKLDLEF
jgi:bacterioferritin-associated ferredoxin